VYYQWGFFLSIIFICMIKLKDILLETIQLIRDRKGKLIGMIETHGSGKQTFRGPTGKFLGWYDPHLDTTRDHTGTVVGKGNLLTSLITIYK